MLRYSLRRLLMMVPTLIGAALLVFLLLRVMPGDIVELKLTSSVGSAVTEETVIAERQRLGLDKSLLAQLGDWLTGLPQGHLGISMWTNRPVAQEIADRAQITLQISVMATVFAILLAVPLGTLSALYRGTWVDHLVRVITIGGIAIPAFWMGMLLLIALLALFQWAPPLRFTPLYEDPLNNIAQLSWPALAVGYRMAALLARMIRSTLLEVLHEDYIRTARAKGVRERVVVWRHALRNALLPAVTVVGVEFAMLIGGLMVTEQVFNLNGIGRLFIESVNHGDYIMLQGLVMVSAVLFMVVNLVVDLLYAALDPRVKY
jgi:peptide/nickel transport system permease protein